jgi:hypothetical protein
MKEIIIKLVTTVVFMIAGLLGYNQIADPAEADVWAVLITGVSGVGGYYLSKALHKAEPPPSTY